MKNGRDFACVGFLSYDKAAQKLVLRQFHVEGFVNQYVLVFLVREDEARVLAVAHAKRRPGYWLSRV